MYFDDCIYFVKMNLVILFKGKGIRIIIYDWQGWGGYGRVDPSDDMSGPGHQF
jgi:hypothetical protein